MVEVEDITASAAPANKTTQGSAGANDGDKPLTKVRRFRALASVRAGARVWSLSLAVYGGRILVLCEPL